MTYPQHTERCQRCGGDNITWHAPSPLWNAVMRYPDGLEASETLSIVCPLCFAKIAEEIGIVSKNVAWCLRAPHGGVLAKLPTTSPDGRTWDGAQCLWMPRPAPKKRGTE